MKEKELKITYEKYCYINHMIEKKLSKEDVKELLE